MAMPRKSFKTEKGTELPLLSLKGKEYLQVMHRLVWFREKYPSGVIKTQVLEHNGAGKDEFYVVKAEIYVPADGSGPAQLLASGHKRENVGSFADALEKAETGAIGRALAMMGVGTQFCFDELDEGDRLADAPAPVLESTETAVTTSAASTTASGDGSGAKRRSSFRKRLEPVDSAAVGDDI